MTNTPGQDTSLAGVQAQYDTANVALAAAATQHTTDTETIASLTQQLADCQAAQPKPSTRLPVFLTPEKPATYSNTIPQMKALPWVTGPATYNIESNGDLKWGPYWDAMAKAYPDSLDVLTMASGMQPASLETWLNTIPKGWRVVVSNGQELEDNLTTAAQIADFKARNKDLAAVLAKHGLALAAEWQEWYLNPANGSAKGQAAKMTSDDIGIHLWSILTHTQSLQFKAQVDRVKGWMDTNAKGKPWGIASGGSALSYSAPTDTQRTKALTWVQGMFPYARQQGAQYLAYYGSYGYPGNDNDYRLASNPLLTNEVMTKAMTG